MPFNRIKILENRFIFIQIRPFPKKGILGLTRERNESLVLKDSLDHFSVNTDGVLLLDDDSSDNSLAIAFGHPSVVGIILNLKWSRDRANEETVHRRLLHEIGKTLKPRWFFYADADERFEGNIKGYLQEIGSNRNIDAVRISLFDSYITKDDQKPYEKGKLLNYRKWFGKECRNILMVWRNVKSAKFVGKDAREPSGIDTASIVTKFYCQHFGKSISIEQWDETCRYYSENFPMYSDKWKKRFGKAIHSKTDFDTPLVSWQDAKNDPVIIHPI